MRKVIGEIVEETSFGAGASVGATVRFRAPNGAVVTVSLENVDGAQDRERMLGFAREAVAQVVSAGNAREPEARYGRSEPADCGAAFWSWARPAL